MLKNDTQLKQKHDKQPPPPKKKITQLCPY